MATSILSDKKLRIFFVAWWLVCMILHYILLKDISTETGHAVIDSVISISLLAVCCFFISNNMQFYLPRQEKYWYILITSLAISGICVLLQQGLMWAVFKSDDNYLTTVRAYRSVRFGAGFLLTSSLNMFSLLWYGQQEQKATEARKTATENLTKEAELYKLRQQLQPHFLFNSLNSISALTGSQPEKARFMIQQLSDFLRGTLKKEEQQWNTLDEEVAYLQLYLEIEKVRFGHRLQTELLLTNETAAMKIPAMVLQPIVENAIKFGLYDTTGDVLIRLKSSANNGDLNISVQNPFDPETSIPLKGTGFGLSSIQRRLFLLFARHDLLETKKENNIFTTTLLIPQII